MIRSFFFIAGELSADRYAARLLAALRERIPDLQAEAIGGPHLRASGVSLFRDSSGWGAIGIAEAVKRYPPIKRSQLALKKRLLAHPPDLLIPLDFGAFNVPTALFARQNGIPVCYAVPPGSWRPDGGRASGKLAACADLFLTPFAPNERVLKEAGLDARFLGHPLLDFIPTSSSRQSIRESLGLSTDAPVLALLPGSRGQELKYLAPVMLEAATRLGKTVSGLELAIPPAPSLPAERVDGLLNRFGWRRVGMAEGYGPVAYDGPVPLRLARGRALDVLSAADAALVCSGTATLEAALVGCPMVIGYRGGGATVIEYLLRKAVVPEHIGLPNILLGRRNCPELIQEDCTPERMVEEAGPLLSGSPERQKQLEGFAELRAKLGEPGVFSRWADAIVEKWGG